MAVGVRLHAEGALDGIRAARRALRTEVPKATTRSGAFTRTAVRANASSGTHRPGRPHIPGTGPGPNVATGDYRRGISQTNHEAPGLAISETGTDAVQAARLERGFVGQDSLGRHYMQPAYPHWEPAAPIVEEFADQQMDSAADKVAAALGSLNAG
jgi:hypothetical protein